MNTKEFGVACVNENDTELSEPLNLETLNSDCQQLILDYFEIKDLLNVAETSKTLQAAACLAFKRKYGRRYVALTDIRTEYCTLSPDNM